MKRYVRLNENEKKRELIRRNWSCLTCSSIPLGLGDYWCSSRCKNIALQSDKPNKPTCSGCTKAYVPTKSRANFFGFCNKKCLINSRKKNYKKVTLPSKEFYLTKPWLELRYFVLKKHAIEHGRICLLCGNSNKPLHVDHIKPRSKFPELELDPYNLQVLCESCNLGKSNKDDTDWRNL